MKLTLLRRDLKKTVKRKELNYKNTIMEQMNHSKKDGKKFWKLLDRLERKNDDTSFKKRILSERWTSHFKSVFQSQRMNLPLPRDTAETGFLDYEITEEEIYLCAYVLRNRKASAYDRISNEMLSCLLKERPELLKNIFNALLQT